MSELAKYLRLKSKHEGDNKDNRNQMRNNITNYFEPAAAKLNSEGMLSRAFNELYGPYKKIDRSLASLEIAASKNQLDLWYDKLLATVLMELFNRDGNFLPEIWEILNEGSYLNKFEPNMLKNQIVGSFMVNIVAGRAFDKFFYSNPDIYNSLTQKINERNRIEIKVSNYMHDLSLRQKSFAETRLGKILIASITAIIISPILFIAAVAVGITLPISLPIGVAIVAAVAGFFTAAATGLVDWIAYKFKAKMPKKVEVASIDNSPENKAPIASTYTKSMETLNSNTNIELFNFLAKKINSDVSLDQNKDIKIQLVNLLKDITYKDLLVYFEDMIKSKQDLNILSSYKNSIVNLVKYNEEDLAHLIPFEQGTKLIEEIKQNETKSQVSLLNNNDDQRFNLDKSSSLASENLKEDGLKEEQSQSISVTLKQ